MRDAVNVVRPQDIQVPAEALLLLPRHFAEQFSVCPLALADGKTGRTMAVATVDPKNVMLSDELQRITQCRIQLVLATAQDIARGIEVHYSAGYSEAPVDLLGQIGSPEVIPSTVTAQDRGTSATVEGILQNAIAERASDIHIEPQLKTVYVRFRVDGVMYDYVTYDLSQHAQIISRIKILSKLDIGQNRLPQDGHFEMAPGGQEYDVRVSVIPSTSGEKAVLRLLPKGQLAFNFEQLGIRGRNLELLDEMIHRPFGMTLVTGPTGSGKTTTLYVCLARIDCVSKNVITTEDPVEYQFPRITQIQVHPKIGLTFATALRSILRQDPDIIMVGEIRDLETLQISVQSALTGHMVLSTLHCNDSAAGAARMIDMGAEPFLIASSLNCIVSQRLVRKICEDCKEPTEISSLIRERLCLSEKQTFYTGRGCGKCRHTGYSGRIGLYEIAPMFDSVQQAIVRKASSNEIREIMRELKIPNLLDDGLEKAREGIVSLDEVMRTVLSDSSVISC